MFTVSAPQVAFAGSADYSDETRGLLANIWFLNISPGTGPDTPQIHEPLPSGSKSQYKQGHKSSEMATHQIPTKLVGVLEHSQDSISPAGISAGCLKLECLTSSYGKKVVCGIIESEFGDV